MAGTLGDAPNLGHSLILVKPPCKKFLKPLIMAANERISNMAERARPAAKACRRGAWRVLSRG